MRMKTLSKRHSPNGNPGIPARGCRLLAIEGAAGATEGIMLPVMYLGVALVLLAAPDLSSYILLLAGIGLHVGYQYFMIVSCNAGDLTQVYSLAR